MRKCRYLPLQARHPLACALDSVMRLSEPLVTGAA